MGEFESMWDIARRLMLQYRQKRQYSVIEAMSEVPADVQAALELLKQPELQLDWIDREFLKDLGIKA